MPSFIVTMRCVVTKAVVCDDCTEDQARECPWDFAVEETETGQDDWTVIGVEVNE